VLCDRPRWTLRDAPL